MNWLDDEVGGTGRAVLSHSPHNKQAALSARGRMCWYDFMAILLRLMHLRNINNWKLTYD